MELWDFKTHSIELASVYRSRSHKRFFKHSYVFSAADLV